MAKTKYRPGDFLRIDDRSGFRTYASKTKQEWTGSIVNERLWESRQPQDFVKGVRDQQAVPQPRPIQLPEVFIGTQPSIFIYNDPNIGSSFIIEDATGPGPYYTPSFGHAFVEIIPGNGFANDDVTPPPEPPVVDSDPPVITTATFTLVQPVLVDDPVGSIFATEVDNTAVWEILAAGINFKIVTDADGSGLLSVSHTNIPAPGNYTLLLKVTNDAGLFGLGVVNVHVQAIAVPFITGFTTSITLGSITLGQILGTVTATNGPNTFAITNGNSLGFFTINTSTGVITTTTATPVENTYILTVSANNGPGTGFGTVTITVLPEPPPPPPPPGGTLFTDESFVPILG